MFEGNVEGRKVMGAGHTYYLARSDPWEAMANVSDFLPFFHEIGPHFCQKSPNGSVCMTFITFKPPTLSPNMHTTYL